MIGLATHAELLEARDALHEAEVGAMFAAPVAHVSGDRAFELICAVLGNARPGPNGGELRVDLAQMNKLCIIALDLEAVITGADLAGDDVGEFYSDLRERIDALIEDRPVRTAPQLVTAASPAAGTA
jgi:hypothetical protein